MKVRRIVHERCFEPYELNRRLTKAGFIRRNSTAKGCRFWLGSRCSLDFRSGCETRTVIDVIRAHTDQSIKEVLLQVFRGMGRHDCSASNEVLGC